MDRVTVCFAYYDNPSMLEKHIDEWRKFYTAVIVVDDASPNYPAVDILNKYCLENVKLYRVLKNIPWNQNGARNLAMQQCTTEWALMLDMDHLLTEKECAKMQQMEKRAGHYYVPRRVWPDGVEHRLHPNSFLLEKEKFWQCGGYDEDFCGYYGSDKVFRLALDTVAQRVETDCFNTVLYEGIIQDANTQEFGRKDSEYHSANHPHLVAKRARAPYKAENPIRFTWERQL